MISLVKTQHRPGGGGNWRVFIINPTEPRQRHNGAAAASKKESFSPSLLLIHFTVFSYTNPILFCSQTE